MTAPSATALDGYKASTRPANWVKHENVPPMWSAAPHQTTIEIVHKGCLEDPYRPVIIEIGRAHV